MLGRWGRGCRIYRTLIAPTQLGSAARHWPGRLWAGFIFAWDTAPI